MDYFLLNLLYLLFFFAGLLSGFLALYGFVR